MNRRILKALSIASLTSLSLMGCQGGEETAANVSSSPIQALNAESGSYTELDGFELQTVNVKHEVFSSQFKQTFDATPAIFLSAASYYGADAGLAMIDSVSNLGFDIKFQEWDYLDDFHRRKERIDVLAIEPGQYLLEDGTQLEVGFFSLDADVLDAYSALDWKQVQFRSSFASTPYVFVHQQTRNDAEAFTLRMKETSSSGFSVAISEQESNYSDGHVVERIAYMAIAPSDGQFGEINANGKTFPFAVKTQDVNIGLVDIANGFQIKLDEEKSRDTEKNHSDETVSALFIGGKMITQLSTTTGIDNVSLRMKANQSSAFYNAKINAQAKQIDLKQSLSQPAILATVPTFAGKVAGVVTVTDVQADKFSAEFSEWNYQQDGIHSNEEMSFIALDQGVYTYADGTLLEVGALDLSAAQTSRNKLDWYSHAFLAGFNSEPYLFTTQMTKNDSDVTTVRVKNLSNVGLDLALSEQESTLGDGHSPAEQIAYWAIQPPVGETSGVMEINGDELFYSLESLGVDEQFVPAVNGYEIKFHEERSYDGELNHSIETVYLMTVNGGVFGQAVTTTGADNGSLRIRPIADPSSSVEPSVVNFTAYDHWVYLDLETGEVGAESSGWDVAWNDYQVKVAAGVKTAYAETQSFEEVVSTASVTLEVSGQQNVVFDMDQIYGPDGLIDVGSCSWYPFIGTVCPPVANPENSIVIRTSEGTRLVKLRITDVDIASSSEYYLIGEYQVLDLGDSSFSVVQSFTMPMEIHYGPTGIAYIRHNFVDFDSIDANGEPTYGDFESLQAGSGNYFDYVTDIPGWDFSVGFQFPDSQSNTRNAEYYAFWGHLSGGFSGDYILPENEADGEPINYAVTVMEAYDFGPYFSAGLNLGANGDSYVSFAQIEPLLKTDATNEIEHSPWYGFSNSTSVGEAQENNNVYVVETASGQAYKLQVSDYSSATSEYEVTFSAID